jgi:hypothetical protein
MVFRTTGGISYLEPMASEPAAAQQEVIIISEKQSPPSA